MVAAADAEALVVDLALALKLRGHDPVITSANEIRLVRLGALMLDAFCIGTRETAEENDG